MKNIIQYFFNPPGNPLVDKQQLRDDIRHNNVFRTLLVIVSSIVVSVAIIVLDDSKSTSTYNSKLYWKKDALLLNEVVLAIFLVLAAISVWQYKNQLKNVMHSELITNLVCIILPLWGIIGCIFDQHITSSIISFLVVCVVISMGFLIKPLHSILIFTLSYLLFYWGLAYTQTDPELLAFNRMAGFWCVAIATGLSVSFWRNNIDRLSQNQIISTQKKELEANYNKLLTFAEELQTAIATKDKFFSILGHDLRGPLTSALSLTQMINEAGHDPDDLMERETSMKMVEGGLQNIIKLLEDLLLWSQTQTHTISFAPQPIHLWQAIDANVKLLEVTASKKTIQIENLTNPSVMVFADKNMLNTILRNLISNAVKFSYPGSTVKLNADIFKETTTGADLINIKITDNGVGISEKTLQNLFKIEHKITTPGTDKEKGTGLGLILCKELVEIHGGGIAIESKPGKGTSIVFHLKQVA